MVSRRRPRVQTAAVEQNDTESDVQNFEFYVSGGNPENQRHLHVVSCEDTKLALSMEITSSLRHSLQYRTLLMKSNRFSICEESCERLAIWNELDSFLLLNDCHIRARIQEVQDPV